MHLFSIHMTGHYIMLHITRPLWHALRLARQPLHPHPRRIWGHVHIVPLWCVTTSQRFQVEWTFTPALWLGIVVAFILCDNKILVILICRYVGLILFSALQQLEGFILITPLRTDKRKKYTWSSPIVLRTNQHIYKQKEWLHQCKIKVLEGCPTEPT